MEIQIDKSEWQKVRLGDVAFEYSKRINNPSESGLEHFVGNSNIGQWDFRVKSWEPTDSVTSAMKLFELNDYLLVRRSLYASDFRERAPRAHFAGVCSGDIITIKENPEFISDGFLIGVLNSPTLWKFVVANASGSITRRIKWKDLANYEFLLPPKEQQAKLAEMLWAMDDVIEKELKVLDMLKISGASVFQRLVNKGAGKKVALSTLLKPIKLKSSVPHQREKYIGLEHIQSGAFTCEKHGKSDSVLAQCNVVNKGDLCYSKLRPYLDKAFLATFDAVSTTELLIYGVKDASKEYVLYHLHSQPFIHYVSGKGFGTKMPRVSHKIIGEYKVKVLEDEKVVLDKMKGFRQSEVHLAQNISAAKNLQKSLINQVF